MSLSLGKFAEFYWKATPETKTRLRAVNAALSIVHEVFMTKFKYVEYIGLIPFWGSRRWGAYLKVHRVADYLMNRRDEVIQEKKQ